MNHSIATFNTYMIETKIKEVPGSKTIAWHGRKSKKVSTIKLKSCPSDTQPVVKGWQQVFFFFLNHQITHRNIIKVTIGHSALALFTVDNMLEFLQNQLILSSC